MDASLVGFLFVGSTILFAILALAKDREGKRYGVKRMALLWVAALSYFLSSAFEFTAKHADGTIESVKITHSTWFLLIMPGAMIAENIARKKKTKQSPETDRSLREVLSDTKAFIKKSEESIWAGLSPAEIATDLDIAIDRIDENKAVDASHLKMLFAPTGPLQESAMASGWSEEYMRLSKEFDAHESKKDTNRQEKDFLLRQRTVMLEGEITNINANDVIARILYLQSLSLREPIHLVITSPGGSVSAGLAIIETIDQVHPPVYTHCIKQAHSMAAVILACGRAGSRSISADAVISFSMPEAADSSKKTDAARFGSILVSKVSQATNRPVSQIRNLFVEAQTLSAKQAVDLKIVDRIGSLTKATK
jgi:ATP-dependent Clp protease protease subunit